MRDTLEIVAVRLKAADAEMDTDLGDELAVLAGSVACSRCSST